MTIRNNGASVACWELFVYEYPGQGRSQKMIIKLKEGKEAKLKSTVMKGIG